MRVRLARPALADLEAIHSYIAQDDPGAASRVVRRLVDRAMLIGAAPYQGREVDEPSLRVIVVPRLRYFIFYGIKGDDIEIVHIRHASRRRPREER